MTYPEFVGGTAATVLDNTPSATTLPYPSGISANDQVIVQASWADRTYWSPPPERLLGDSDPHGFIYTESGNYQNTQTLRDTTRLGPNLPMQYRPAEDSPAALGHFITFRLWAFRNADSPFLWVGGNIITDGVRDAYPFTTSTINDAGPAAVDTTVVFGLAVNPLTRYVGDSPTYPPTPVRPTFSLVGFSSNLLDVGSLMDVGADEPLGHAAWLAHIPNGAETALNFDVRIAGCAGQVLDFDLFAYYLPYRLDPAAPPVGGCPARQAATPGTNALRVRAHA